MILNSSDKNNILTDNIFTLTKDRFEATALSVFHFQYSNNEIYRQFCQALKIDSSSVNSLKKIPFLPIRFFKSHQVITTAFNPEIIFESSGTTNTINSQHFVKDIELYKKSFTKGFSLFYGNPEEWCILALLPSYLERQHSSLVMMAEELIKLSKHSKSGFYLYNMDELFDTIRFLEKNNQKTILLGATFALLDFAEKFSYPLRHTTIMETGGMKGRREEMTREIVHDILKNKFELDSIYSEYGMTELLSQAYSNGNGIFYNPPWMKVLIREEDDPLSVHSNTPDKIVAGAVNIIDLANLYSCSFIATDDAGKLYPDDSFEILGRLDNSDIRGCSLLTI